MVLHASLGYEMLLANVAHVFPVPSNVGEFAVPASILLDMFRAIGEISKQPAAVGALVRLYAQVSVSMRLVLIL